MATLMIVLAAIIVVIAFLSTTPLSTLFFLYLVLAAILVAFSGILSSLREITEALHRLSPPPAQRTYHGGTYNPDDKIDLRGHPTKPSK